MRSKRSEKSSTTASEIRLGRGKRDVKAAVSFVLEHRTRAAIRAILNEGERGRNELARLTDQPASRVGWHIKELLTDGTIELGRPKRVGSAVKHYYRAVDVPSYGNKEIAAMPPETRQALAGVVLQAGLAEALAAFWVGRMVSDRNVMLAWRWFNVDAHGREAIADEQARSAARMREIAAKAFGRRVKSGGPSISIIVSSFGYSRFRFSRLPPVTALDEMESAIEVALALGQGERSVEDAVFYAIGDKLRVEILAILNEGVRNRYELAALTGETPDKIKHHLKELRDEGSIELAYQDPVGNVTQYYYRAVRMPSYSAEEFAALPPGSRQVIAGLTLQAVVAEALAAFRAGTMIDDRQFRLAWRWYQVDAKGREEMTKEQERSWARVQEIEAEALGRVAESGESTKSIIVTSLGFVRAWRAAPGSLAVGPAEFVTRGTDLGSRAQSAQVE
jgi:DNA-binding transcriptional ArsR family regulator